MRNPERDADLGLWPPRGRLESWIGWVCLDVREEYGASVSGGCGAKKDIRTIQHSYSQKLVIVMFLNEAVLRGCDVKSRKMHGVRGLGGHSGFAVQQSGLGSSKLSSFAIIHEDTCCSH